MENPVNVVLEAFAAVERRDDDAFSAIQHPDFELHWPASLPYGGVVRAREAGTRDRPGWEETWDPLQTDTERQMDPRVVAASDDEVVVLWCQRGHGPMGERFSCPVLGLYGVRDGKLARAQMFYFDTVAVRSFLDRAMN